MRLSCAFVEILDYFDDLLSAASVDVHETLFILQFSCLLLQNAVEHRQIYNSVEVFLFRRALTFPFLGGTKSSSFAQEKSGAQEPESEGSSELKNARRNVVEICSVSKSFFCSAKNGPTLGFEKMYTKIGRWCQNFDTHFGIFGLVSNFDTNFGI